MVDLIRSGKAPEVIRRKGAEGTLPVPTEDKIEILTLLMAGRETGISEKALQTLRHWNPADIRSMMASPQTAPDVLRCAAQFLAPEREGLRETLLWNPSLPHDVRAMMEALPGAEPAPLEPAAAAVAPAAPTSSLSPAPAAAATAAAAPQPSPSPDADVAAIEILARLASGTPVEGADGAEAEALAEVTKRDDELTPRDRETLIQKIGGMTVVEKIKAALTGNMETRNLLIRDSNKMISRAVLQSPKISDTEAEGYAAAKNVSEEVLRLIASNRKFMKSYVVMRALLNNPRAPIDVTMPLIARLNERDLKGLSLNRNIPEVIRSLAIKAIKQREDATKPKLPGKH